MKITSISVRGLFGLFDHVIPLTHSDRVTIIHGPNGFGKTVMLRMIASFVDGKTGIFERIPFREFRVTLADGSCRIIERHTDPPAEGMTPHPRLDFIVIDEKGQTKPFEPTTVPSEIPRRFLTMVDTAVPGPYRLVGSQWTDDQHNFFSLAQILEKFPLAAENLPKKYRPGFLFDVSQDLEVFFIETNRLVEVSSRTERPRLLHSGRPRTEREVEGTLPRVEHHSRDVLERIQLVTSAYARRSQERDRTFPERLVRFVRDGQAALPEREILTRMTNLESKRKRLNGLGLLDSNSGLLYLTEEDVRRAPEALTIYVGDMEHKLNVFDDVARRIGSLVDIINSRFKYKKLVIDRDKGFHIVSDLDQVIRLHDLSSGEQHELIVLYELLFHGPENGLVLVDEPEISLHVGWQSRFLADLITIVNVIGAYAIVATHSPVIIGSRSDLTEQLKGPTSAEEQSDHAREY